MKRYRAFYDTPEIESLEIEAMPAGKITKRRLNLVTDQLGDFIQVPVIVVKGVKEGPVMGITAAIHGNELNGTLLVHHLIQALDPTRMSGALVAIPILNVPGFKQQTRTYWDGSDLNRSMPGKEEGKGTAGEVYAYHIIHQIISRFDYLIDLHTASSGRINSWYVRADLEHKIAAKMAFLQNPQIIVNTTGHDQTLRNAATRLGIPAIVVEIGNPLTFQEGLIQKSMRGILRILDYLNMLEYQDEPFSNGSHPVVCSDSFWVRTDVGGLLQVGPRLAEMVEAGHVLAQVTNAFGDPIHDFYAEQQGVVIGKAINPVCLPGSRVIHLGVPVTDVNAAH